MPSSNTAFKAVIQLIDESGTGTVVDLGSGWGNLVIRLARRYPQRQIIGYELSLLPWLTTKIIGKCLRLKNLTLYKQDFYKADLYNASLLICYLDPLAMLKIKNKLAAQPGNINFLISNNFALPAWQPEKVIRLNDFYKSPVFLYRVSRVPQKTAV
ncbi:class I SAM-dependent methyltransferase [Psychromonas aquimarina]|uniref:class I SAM-dependent methyltransferase n=1 Tax=Psychromonas aquimarina TaxID=444919 RepID=UPI000684A857|nr:class I SAM-dependent methyltransferase [Psychromonas aquimarina]